MISIHNNSAHTTREMQLLELIQSSKDPAHLMAVAMEAIITLLSPNNSDFNQPKT